MVKWTHLFHHAFHLLVTWQVTIGCVVFSARKENQGQYMDPLSGDDFLNRPIYYWLCYAAIGYHDAAPHLSA